jgi:hypothetical protein
MKKDTTQYAHNYYLLIGAAACIILAAGAGIQQRELSRLKKMSNQDLAPLRETMPDFDSRALAKLKQEAAALEDKLIGLSAIFDPRYKWIKKDYDLSIYFIEELGTVRQFLKAKGLAKKVAVPELGFKEKLPSEQEALYLLSQLYAIKETVSLGMDYGINFKTITPLAVAEAKSVGGNLIRSRFEMSSPGATLIEFILQLNEIVPRVVFNSLSLKSNEQNFDVDLVLEQVAIDSGLPPANPAAVLQAQVRALSGEASTDYVHVLRNNNPFVIPALPPQTDATGQAVEPARQKSRFIYRGKARKQSRQVVVVEDSLNQETVFVGLEERIGNFTLIDFSDDAIVLKNIQDNTELIIKRED